jgi:hypothetical protein
MLHARLINYEILLYALINNGAKYTFKRSFSGFSLWALMFHEYLIIKGVSTFNENNASLCSWV